MDKQLLKLRDRLRNFVDRLQPFFAPMRRRLEDFRDEIWWGKEGEPPIPDLYSEINTLKKINARIEAIQASDDTLQEILSYCKEMFEYEEKRGESIENKATLLAGFSGTAAAVVLPLLISILDSDRFVEASLGIPGGIILAILIIACLTLSSILSIHVLGIRTYHCPNLKRILDFAHKDTSKICKQWTAQYFFALIRNQPINNCKVNAYKYAVKCFRRATFFLLFFSLLFMLHGLFNPVHPLPSSVATITPTPSPTITPTLTLTQTLTSTTTPSLKPTSTPTASSTLTSTQSSTPAPTKTATP